VASPENSPVIRPEISIVVRTFNSAATLDRTLDSVRSQTLPAQIVVVDSGSTDDTLRIARDRADRVGTLAHAEFSYGRALNVGARLASSPYCGSLSSHTVLPRTDWLEIAHGHLTAGAVATCGGETDGAGNPLTEPLRADAAYLRRHRYWGFTNTASLWDNRVWRGRVFDESLVASEDQEWSWRAVEAGGPLVVDPRLTVSGSHRRTAGLRAYHRRMVREIRALEHVRPLSRYPVLRGVTDWARSEPSDPFVSSTRAFGRTRLLDIAARWDAGRQAGQGFAQPRIEARPVDELSQGGEGQVRADA